MVETLNESQEPAAATAAVTPPEASGAAKPPAKPRIARRKKPAAKPPALPPVADASTTAAPDTTTAMPLAAVTAATPATVDPQPRMEFSRRLGDRHLLDSDALENIDRMTNVALGQLSGGISPASLAMAYLDWTVHLAASPGKQFQLAAKATRKAMRLGAYALSSAITGNAEPTIKPLPGDHRFDHPGWQRFPYNVIYQGFLLNQQWWHNATTGIRGVSKHGEAA
ncbi:MAG TPA: poly-beta-hydroxybutyrate polymerase N-terminal domain-containing protein, partial [Candidatus Accumulibacter phosphatis]|nr:poly-beta-hydroxybutyrate polymerase N-terminal domain-containing protein [Candidatus Accumulibacter phosphatis]